MISLKKVVTHLIILPLIISNTAIAAIAEAKKNPQQELLIWRVDPKPGSIYSVYLLGSIHAGKTCQIDSPAFERAFQDAETVAFEVDSLQDPELLAKESQRYISQLIREKGRVLNSSDSLRGILEAETYQLLKEKMAAIDFPLDSFAQLKPWVFMFAFTSAQIAQTEYKSECGLDFMITELSQQENKDIAGLETLDYQLDKFTDLFISMDTDEISETVLAISQAKSFEQISEYINQEFDSLSNNVNSGNVEQLELTLNNWCQEDPQECESLLYVRNRNWIPKIEDFLNQKRDTLVVVGAGHLVGRQSVIELLKQQGYKVRRVYNNFRMTEE